MALQDIVRLVLPKEDHFFDFLEAQAAFAHEAAVALTRVLDGDIPKVRDEVHAIEKRADKVAHELEDALAATFVTPLDREDIHRLSSLLDDIADRAHATTRAFDMFGIEKPSEPAVLLMELLVKSTKELRDLLPSLRKHEWETIRKGRRRLKELEKQGDEVYRNAIRALFAQTGTSAIDGPYHGMTLDARNLIREKEVIEILEDAVDTCEDVGEYLTNLAVKHG